MFTMSSFLPWRSSNFLCWRYASVSISSSTLEAPHLTAPAIRKQSQLFPPFRFCSLCKTLQAPPCFGPLKCPPDGAGKRAGRYTSLQGGGLKLRKSAFLSYRGSLRAEGKLKSGLLQAEEIRDESLNKVNFADDPSYYLFSQSEADEPSQQKKPSKEIDRTRKIHFTALISPKYAPNVFVRMDSSKGDSYDSAGSMAIKGDFIITECTFRGSNMGSDFTVECDAREVNW